METEINTREKIKHFITKSASLDIDTLPDDELIFEQGLLDSMGLLFLIDFIKEEFNVEVKDNELVVENFESVNHIASFVCKKLTWENENMTIIN